MGWERGVRGQERAVGGRAERRWWAWRLVDGLDGLERLI